MNKREKGAGKELLAAEYLRTQDYKIVEHNFYTDSGEIDLIGHNDGYLCFIEVKYRKNRRNGYAAEAVTPLKMKRIIGSANYYMLTHGYREECPVRFDVVAIDGDDIRLIKNAFEYF